MKDWQASALTLHLPIMKKTNRKTLKQNRKAKQARKNAEGVQKHDAIFLGLDLHSVHIRLVRQVDEATPQPAQKFGWGNIVEFCKKQLELAKKVYAVYEAGAFGYGLHRQLTAIGVECYVVKPRRLDPDNKRVQNDNSDATELCHNLWRFVRGNDKAMVVVRVPSEEQEAQRVEARHRKHLQQELQSMTAHGRGLLLFHGIRSPGKWWEQHQWDKIKGQLPAELQSALEDCRKIIAEYQKMLTPVSLKLMASAPEKLPLAMGKLTFILLLREVYDWNRFKNRRNVGSFFGLCGGVSSSGPSHYDLGITKRGSPYLRALLVEMAWRMVRYQPNYHAVKKWSAILKNPKAHLRHRKRAIVAVARQLAVDIWKWQTGRATPEQLGWV